MSKTIEVAKIPVHIMGKKYMVPMGLTIMEAMEYAGYRYTRGAGCRAGFCGACATIYRKEGDYRIYVALACQTSVEEGMFLVQLPFTPALRADYDVEKLEASDNVLLSLYPEVARCVSCNTCSKACPQDLDVMDYIQAAKRGDIEKVARLSFDCVQCGLCSMRCPAEIPHFHVGQLARRLYGRYLGPKSQILPGRAEKIINGGYEEDFNKLFELDLDGLKKLYVERLKRK